MLLLNINRIIISVGFYIENIKQLFLNIYDYFTII